MGHISMWIILTFIRFEMKVENEVPSYCYTLKLGIAILLAFWFGLVFFLSCFLSLIMKKNNGLENRSRCFFPL